MASGSAAASSSNWVMESGDIPHVLAVDDNLIDRKLVEKLLRNSSCKGKPAISQPCSVFLSLFVLHVYLLLCVKKERNCLMLSFWRRVLNGLFGWVMFIGYITVTTAENGPMALELLGLTSGEQSTLNGVSFLFLRLIKTKLV